MKLINLLKQKEQKLEKANTQTKAIYNISNDVDKILDNLKPTLMNKNNMVISSEDVQKLKNYTRDEIQSLIEENGGLWSSSVTKNTFAVVVGENPGSKYDKAKELNVPIWDEEKFQKMIEEA